MSLNSGEDECSSSREVDDVESPRKKPRLDNSTRKSWSLMDRRTNYEVLQEMGVSILEPDDGDALCESGASGSLMHHHKPMKRKRDIENVNPNVNTAPSPRARGSPRSPRVKSSPGPSRIKSPRSTEKYKPLQPAEQHLLETTILDEYLIDEETPLGQCVSAHYMPRGSGFEPASEERRESHTPIRKHAEPLLQCHHRTEPVGCDSFDVLSDEMMLSIFKWLPKRTLAQCMLVCKRWYRMACDETLWQRLELGNKTLSRDALGKILSRKPIVVRLASSEIAEWHPTSVTTSRIQYLDMSMTTVEPPTLTRLLARCPLLKKVSLESVLLSDAACKAVGNCANLETLNLTMAQGITAKGLTEILNGCTNLQALNISWCSLTETALLELVTKLPQRLQRLNIGGARILTDAMLQHLCQRCPRLLELDLSDCSQLEAGTIPAVLTLTRLEHLALSRCYLLTAQSLTKFSSMPALQYLEVWGMLHTAALNALRSALPAIQVNQFMFSAIARPTVGARRTSLWGLKTRD